MAASQLIPTGSGLAHSAEITVNAGDTIPVAIKGATAGPATVGVFLKDDEGGFNRILDLKANDGSPPDRSGTVLTIPGVYRLTRRAGDGICGAFRG